MQQNWLTRMDTHQDKVDTMGTPYGSLIWLEKKRGSFI